MDISGLITIKLMLYKVLDKEKRNFAGTKFLRQSGQRRRDTVCWWTRICKSGGEAHSERRRDETGGGGGD